MSTEKKRITIVMDDITWEKFEDFRFSNRFGSQSAAALALIRLGIEVMEKKQKKEEKKS